MSRKRIVSMVGGTISCALAIGFFMQRGESASPRNLAPALPPQVQQAVLEPIASANPDTATAGKVANQATTQNLVLVSSMEPERIPPALPKLAILSAVPVHASTDGIEFPMDPEMPRVGCDVNATATPGALAMVTLDISAPCFTNERVTVHHNGMMFTQVTDEAGHLLVDVPALSDRAVFIISFGDGKGTVALTSVPDLANYKRVVVQWSGKAGFEIHAREFGAAYGETGHVWSGAASDGKNGVGFVTRLGNSDTLAPQMAEIYTFPSEANSVSGIVALSVEAEVTQANCGRDISAQSLEFRDRSPLRTRDLVLTMPDCSALGDFLVLNNLVDNLKIAAR